MVVLLGIHYQRSADKPKRNAVNKGIFNFYFFILRYFIVKITGVTSTFVINQC